MNVDERDIPVGMTEHILSLLISTSKRISSIRLLEYDAVGLSKTGVFDLLKYVK